MKPSFPFFMFVVLTISVSAGYADEASKAKLVESMVHKSGLVEQIKQFPALIEMGLTQARQGNSSLPVEVFEKMKSLVHECFKPETLSASIQSHHVETLAEGDIRYVLDWLDSPLGKQITQLEIDSSSPESMEKMMSMMDQLTKDESRLALIKKLDQSIKASEQGFAIMKNMTFAMMTSMLSMIPDNATISSDQIMNMVNRNMEQQEDQVKQNVINSMLFTYRDLSGDELEKYIAFAESESGKRYHTSGLEGLDKTLRNAGETFGKQFVEYLKSTFPKKNE